MELTKHEMMGARVARCKLKAVRLTLSGDGRASMERRGSADKLSSRLVSKLRSQDFHCLRISSACISLLDSITTSGQTWTEHYRQAAREKE